MKLEYTFKYIIVGDTFCGKTSLVNTFINNYVSFQNQSTIGVEFSSKTINIDENLVKILIWDTAGLERFRSITKSYYKRSSIAFIVYDITNRDSFLNLQYWYSELTNNCNENVTIVIIGNKADLSKRQVSYDEGFKFAEKYDLLFFETSKHDLEQTSNIFEESARLVIREKAMILNDKKLKETGIIINHQLDNRKVSRWCCWF